MNTPNPPSRDVSFDPQSDNVFVRDILRQSREGTLVVTEQMKEKFNLLSTVVRQQVVLQCPDFIAEKNSIQYAAICELFPDGVEKRVELLRRPLTVVFENERVMESLSDQERSALRNFSFRNIVQLQEAIERRRDGISYIRLLERTRRFLQVFQFLNTSSANFDFSAFLETLRTEGVEDLWDRVYSALFLLEGNVDVIIIDIADFEFIERVFRESPVYLIGRFKRIDLIDTGRVTFQDRAEKSEYIQRWLYSHSLHQLGQVHDCTNVEDFTIRSTLAFESTNVSGLSVTIPDIFEFYKNVDHADQIRKLFSTRALSTDLYNIVECMDDLTLLDRENDTLTIRFSSSNKEQISKLAGGERYRGITRMDFLVSDISIADLKPLYGKTPRLKTLEFEFDELADLDFMLDDELIPVLTEITSANPTLQTIIFNVKDIIKDIRKDQESFADYSDAVALLEAFAEEMNLYIPIE